MTSRHDNNIQWTSDGARLGSIVKCTRLLSVATALLEFFFLSVATVDRRNSARLS
jgi:hypothetical protein